MKRSHFIDRVGRALKADNLPDNGFGTWWDRAGADAFAGAAAPPPYNVIKGTAAGETLVGTIGDDKIFARGGGDEIMGLLGDDLLFGGDGNDTLWLDSGAKTYSGGKGRDLLRVPAATPATIDLSDTTPQGTNYGIATILGIENLKGAGGGDTFVGNARDNVMWGRGGNDNISDVAGGDDRIYGGPGDDWLSGGPGIDTLDGGDGNDQLFGGSGKDELIGFKGNDTLNGGSGSDGFYGGPGSDVIMGGGGRDYMFGQGGNDLLDGGPGNDIGKGGAGDDTLWLSPGNDSHDGGPGSDWIGIGGSAGGHVDLSITTRQDTGFGKDIIRNVENVFGSTGPDHIKGSKGDNELNGFLGDDVIRGGRGNDDINGGRGRDTLWGNGGDDAFVFISPLDTPTATPDRIRDFSPGDDVIDLSHIDANTATPGDQAFTWGGQTATANGVWYDPAAGLLFGDVDGDKVADFAIQLDGAPALDDGDLLK